MGLKVHNLPRKVWELKVLQWVKSTFTSWFLYI